MTDEIMKGMSNARHSAWRIGAASALISTIVGLATSMSVHAQEEQATAPAAASTSSGALESRSVLLKDIGAEQPVRLRGTEHQIDFPIAIRNDEVVTKARLKLRYAHSPALIFEWSHLTVLVNNEVVGNVQLKADTADGGEQVVDIDPRTLVGYSRLGLRAVMHYTKDCEDPAHSTLWSVIANESVLELELQRVPLANELALLPEPFFDPRDKRELVLPFVLPAEPTTDELQAAGMVASWFGALAEYRGSRFPAQLGRLPAKGNAVMIAMRPRVGTAVDLAKASGAQVAIADNPTDRNGKLLIVTGDDAATLLAAARALTMGTQALSGASASVRELAEPPLRKAYDAPRWVPTDRVVQIGEQVAPDQLQVRGQYPPAIRVPWDLPPDLFYWKSKGAKLDVGYRYTPTPGQKSTLDFDVNNQFARAVPLLMVDSPTPMSEEAKKKAGLPEVSKREKYYVPVYKFASDNELKWQYNFEMWKKGECEDVPEDNLRGSIDADSTIDLTSLPHYTYLPDLKLFMDGAFPFSKFADLAQTVVVLPSRPSAVEVAAFLNVMGHIGDATGFPATRLRVSDASSVKASGADADLLVIGTPASQPLLSEWADHMPVTTASSGMQLQVIGAVERLRARFEGRDLEGARAHATRMILEAGKGLGSLMSFESPLARHRTVVVFAAQDEARLL
ncbi:MAG: cellulose biosynthesis cyclic di-GMP-binding regulatory protein BcsB, partial [Panacagrimonas sp.]